MDIKKRKYTLEKAIADTRRVQGKMILDEDQAIAINELLVELKAYRKISKKISSLTNDLEIVTKKSLEEEIMQFNSLANQPNSPYNPGSPQNGPSINIPEGFGILMRGL